MHSSPSEPAPAIAVGPSNPARVVSIYVALIVAVQAVALLAGPTPATLGDAALVVAILTHFVLSLPAVERGRRQGAPSHPAVRALPALALLPVLGILSVTMVSARLPQLAWYALVGIPVALGVALVVRTLELDRRDLGLGAVSDMRQLWIAATGIPLAVLGYLLARPQPLLAHHDWRTLITGVLILTVFSGFLEETLFRGLIQPRLVTAFGPPGIPLTAVLFAAMYLGTRSAPYVLFAGALGLLYGRLASRTHSIWGVAVSHSLLNVGAILILPLVWS